MAGILIPAFKVLRIVFMSSTEQPIQGHPLRLSDDLITRVVGARIAAVSYLVPEGASWSDEGHYRAIHEVAHGVALLLSSGACLRLTWEMENTNEFISTALISSGAPLMTALIDVVDVSSHSDWLHIIGATIRGLGASWHIANEGCPASTWAIRFDLTPAPSFVVALGELDKGRLRYQPDGIVVVFDKALAESFTIPAAFGSAWGSE